jgi:hypothetical protein
LAEVGWIDRAGDGAVHITNVDPINNVVIAKHAIIEKNRFI